MPDTTDTAALDELWTTLQGATDSSYVVALVSTALDPFRRTTSRLATFTRDSYLYRWLTKEPNPEVVVIDLRETYTVGPFIRLLNTIIAHIEPYWRESGFARLLGKFKLLVERSENILLGHRLGRLLESSETTRGDDEKDGS